MNFVLPVITRNQSALTEPKHPIFFFDTRWNWNRANYVKVIQLEYWQTDILPPPSRRWKMLWFTADTASERDPTMVYAAAKGTRTPGTVVRQWGSLFRRFIRCGGLKAANLNASSFFRVLFLTDIGDISFSVSSGGPSPVPAPSSAVRHLDRRWNV